MDALIKYADVLRPLTIEEFDANLDAIQSAIESLEATGMPGVGLKSVTRGEDGIVTFTGTNDTVLGSFPLTASAPFIIAGAWAPEVAYTERNIVRVAGTSYICGTPHTSAATFQEDLLAGKWMLLVEGAEGIAGIVPVAGQAGKFRVVTTHDRTMEFTVPALVGEGIADVDIITDWDTETYEMVLTGTKDTQWHAPLPQPLVKPPARVLPVDAIADTLTSPSTVQEALEELVSRVKALETENQSLKSRVTALEAQP